MEVDACYQLGYIQGTHGLKGAVHLILDVDDPSAYVHLESVFLGQNGPGPLVPFFISELRLKGSKAVVKFEDIDTLDQAKALIGNTVHMPLKDLPPLSGSSFYFHEIIGSLVKDTEKGELGKVAGIYDQSPQTLIAMNYQQQEILIPLTEDIVHGWDRQSKILEVSLPPGLLEIYLDQ